MVWAGVTTLQLDHAWQPVAQMPWKKAFALVLEGKAEVLEEYLDKAIRTVRQVFYVPSVIRLLTVVHRRRGVRFSRDGIYLRDKGRCQYCDIHLPRSEITYDHVTPRKAGGPTNWTNIVVACLPCNQRKGGRSCAEAQMWPKHAPVRPKSLPGGLRLKGHVPAEWTDYLTYWHGELEQT